MIRIICLFLCALALKSCASESDCDIPAKFQDMTGLDGCGYILVLDLDDEERRLEPINLSDFDLQPQDGLEVCIEFIVRQDMASICQVGEIVELTSLNLE